MKRYIFRQFGRRPLISFLSIAIVAIMICLFFVAVNNHFYAKAYIDSMDEVYSTAVTLDDHVFERSRAIISRMPEDANLPLVLPKETEERLIDAQRESPLVKNLDDRRAVLGFSTTIKPYFPPFEDIEITKKRQELYSKARLSKARADLYTDFVNKHGNADFGYVSRVVMGVVRARCIKVEYLAPIGLRKTDISQSIIKPAETLQDRGLTPDDIPRFSERDHYDRLTILGYFEIDHSHSRLLPGCEEIKYLKVSTKSLTGDFDVPFVEGKLYDLALQLDVILNHPREKGDWDDGLATLGDVKNQRYLYATLFGEQWGERFESLGKEYPSKDFFDHEIPRQLLETLDIQFDKNLVKSVFTIWSENDPPVLEVGNEYDEEALKHFKSRIDSLTTNNSAFQVHITKDPYLLPEVRKQHIRIVEDNLKDTGEKEDKSQCYAYISKELAEQNHLKLGDTFDLRLYQSGFWVRILSRSDIRYPELRQLDKEDQIIYDWRAIGYGDPLAERLATKNLKTTQCVVSGFYELQTDLWLAQDEVFYHPLLINKRGNHIILKANNLEAESQLWGEKIPFDPIMLQPDGMLTAHIENGKKNVQAYKEHMAEKGLDKFIVEVDDQGYALIEEELNNFAKDSRQQTILLLVLSLIMCIGYAFMILYFNKSSDRLQYILGASKRTRRKCIFGLSTLYWLIGNIIGVSVFVYFSSHRTQEFKINPAIDTLDISSSQIVFDPPVLGIMISISLLVLVISYLFAHYLAWRKVKI